MAIILEMKEGTRHRGRQTLEPEKACSTLPKIKKFHHFSSLAKTSIKFIFLLFPKLP